MAGERNRPAMGGGGLVGRRGVTSNSSPEASAGGWFIPLNRLFPSWFVIRTRCALGAQEGLVARKDDVGTPTSKA